MMLCIGCQAQAPTLAAWRSPPGCLLLLGAYGGLHLPNDGNRVFSTLVNPLQKSKSYP